MCQECVTRLKKVLLGVSGSPGSSQEPKERCLGGREGGEPQSLSTLHLGGPRPKSRLETKPPAGVMGPLWGCPRCGLGCFRCEVVVDRSSLHVILSRSTSCPSIL